MRFSSAQTQAFAAFSHDVNPLHCDATYARRTQFGKVVVYGVAGVFQALASWARGRSFRIGSLTASFTRPMFLGEEYELRIDEAGGQVTMAFYQGKTLISQVKAVLALCGPTET